MVSKTSVWLFVSLLIISSILAACGSADDSTSGTKDEGVAMTEAVVNGDSQGPAGEGARGGECCDVYRIGVFEDPLSLNYWAYLGPDSSQWTGYVLDDYAASLYTLSDQRFDFIPNLATDLVEPMDNGDGTWSITVEMVQDATWSDGKPVTAHDVVFTHNTCKDLRLTQNWPDQCAPSGLDITVEALDDYTVHYTFPEHPSLGTWNAGVAQAPILPEHFWAEAVTKAYRYIEGLEEPAIEEPEGVDCAAE
ncbi:MAG: ABC transporter substrate-binding protein, partial [Anaerolineales bacterium]